MDALMLECVLTSAEWCQLALNRLTLHAHVECTVVCTCVVSHTLRSCTLKIQLAFLYYLPSRKLNNILM